MRAPSMGPASSYLNLGRYWVWGDSLKSLGHGLRHDEIRPKGPRTNATWTVLLHTRTCNLFIISH